MEQQQKKKKSSRSMADRLVGTVKDEASALAKKAKEKLVSERQSQDEAERSKLDAELQGDSFAQSVRSHESLQRLSGAKIGRELCHKCHTQESACLYWDVSELCNRKQHAALSTQEQGRLLTNAFNPMPPATQWLYDMTAIGQPLGFPSDDVAYEMVNLATEFLIDLCDNTLAQQLPLLFNGAAVVPVGGWAQESGLAYSHPNLDFVLSLPAWIATNKLCACEFVGLTGTVVQKNGQRLPFETQVHQSAICTLERLVAAAAVTKLQQMQEEGPVKLDYDKGVSYNPGADSQYVWAPKKIVLHVICTTASGGDKHCTLRISFGVPCQLVGRTAAADGSSSDLEPLELCGHLLFGLSEPLMLSVSLEEKKRLLSGAETSNHPRLRLLRMIKFLLRAGQQVSLLKSEITKPDPSVSFIANSIVRETQRRYEMTEEAYYRANFNDRFFEVIDAIIDNRTSIPFFSVDCTFTKITKRKPPKATRRLLQFVKRPAEEQKDTDRLMNLLLQVLIESSDTNMKKVVKEIDSIIGEGSEEQS